MGVQNATYSERVPLVAVPHNQEAYDSLALQGGASQQAHERAVKEAHLKDLLQEAVHELDIAEDVSLSLLQTSVQVIHDTTSAEMDFENGDNQGNEQISKRIKRHKVDTSTEQAAVPTTHHEVTEKILQARQARHE